MVTVVVLCVFPLICHLTHCYHKSEVTTDSSQYGSDLKKGDLAENTSFRSYAIISFTSTYMQYKYKYNTQLVHGDRAFVLTRILIICCCCRLLEYFGLTATIQLSFRTIVFTKYMQRCFQFIFKFLYTSFTY